MGDAYSPAQLSESRERKAIPNFHVDLAILKWNSVNIVTDGP